MRAGDKGPYLYDEICRIPFIAYVPGQTASKSDAYVYNMDLMPTFIDVARSSIPDGLDACSLLPVIKGEVDSVRDRVAFIEFYGHQVPVLQKVIRTDAYKYIFNGPDRDEFYDLVADPGEMENRVDDPACSEQVAEARNVMLAKIEELGDPIRRYYVHSRLH